MTREIQSQFDSVFQMECHPCPNSSHSPEVLNDKTINFREILNIIKYGINSAPWTNSYSGTTKAFIVRAADFFPQSLSGFCEV